MPGDVDWDGLKEVTLEGEGAQRREGGEAGRELVQVVVAEVEAFELGAVRVGGEVVGGEVDGLDFVGVQVEVLEGGEFGKEVVIGKALRATARRESSEEV